MGRLTYTLKINSTIDKFELISLILEVKSTANISNWELDIREESFHYNNAIEYIVNLLLIKISELNKIGILKEDISIWLYYEYEQQCNLELSNKEIKKISELDISVCISCWER